MTEWICECGDPRCEGTHVPTPMIGGWMPLPPVAGSMVIYEPLLEQRKIDYLKEHGFVAAS